MPTPPQATVACHRAPPFDASPGGHIRTPPLPLQDKAKFMPRRQLQEGTQANASSPPPGGCHAHAPFPSP